MFSEFTLNLIEEVKKREILYNTKYERRPKSEKEKNWLEIAHILRTEAEKCKKHWKNVRDRFVKVMNARNKHFSNRGDYATAPVYIYYDKLLFLTEFSTKKELNELENYSIAASDFSPTLLEVETENGVLDLTTRFLDVIKKYPILYDQNAEVRKFRGKAEWKTICDALFGRFTVGQLRNFWQNLIRKYKMYQQHRYGIYGTIKNEYIFELMSFVHQGPEIKTDCSIKSENHCDLDNLYNSVGVKENCEIEIDEEHLIESSVDIEDALEETEVFIENIFEDEEESLIEEPVLKKAKVDSEIDVPPNSSTLPVPESSKHINSTLTDALDEFDHFGKKVALQLRELAKKDRKVSRAAEIHVLQILMQYEDNVEKL